MKPATLKHIRIGREYYMPDWSKLYHLTRNTILDMQVHGKFSKLINVEDYIVKVEKFRVEGEKSKISATNLGTGKVTSLTNAISYHHYYAYHDVKKSRDVVRLCFQRMGTVFSDAAEWINKSVKVSG